MTSQTLTFMPGQFVKTTEVSVGQNAGNNYIIEATPSNGEPIVESEKLTVWRRLWYEIDCMKVLIENDDDLEALIEPIVNSKTVSEFARACISIEPDPGCVDPYIIVPDVEFPPETEEILDLREEIKNLSATISNMLDEADRLDKEGLIAELDALLIQIHQQNDEMDGLLNQLNEALDEYYDSVNVLYEQPREIAQSSPEYWAVHLVGGFLSPPDVPEGDVLGRTMKSTIYVFGYSIYTNLYFDNNEDANVTKTKLPGALSFVTMHELGHALGLSHYSDKNIKLNFCKNPKCVKICG